MRINRNYELHDTYREIKKPHPSFEFMRNYFFICCNEEEKAEIDALVLAMKRNVSKRYYGPFSAANALEVLGALVKLREATVRRGCQLDNNHVALAPLPGRRNVRR